MTAFQDTRNHIEQKSMVHLLSEIERNPSFTQRGLAGQLGIGLGLMNHYLKMCVTKGWVRASQLSPRRIVYFITPEGFREKSHMVTDYLARSMTFFRDARAQCETVFGVCKARGWITVALVGPGDLADIAKLVALGTSIRVEVVTASDDLAFYDAILITDLMNPQKTFDTVQETEKLERIFLLDLLHISKVASA